MSLGFPRFSQSFCFRFFLGFCKVCSSEELQLAVEEIFCWNSLPGLQRQGSQAVKLENHIAWGWTKGDWGRRKLVNRKWLELRLRKELLGERKVFRDVKEIFGASLSRKSTLNSALINLKEQELLEVSHPSLLPQSSAPSQHWSTFSSREFQEQDRKWSVRQELVEFQERTKIIPYLQAFLGTQVRIRTET